MIFLGRALLSKYDEKIYNYENKNNNKKFKIMKKIVFIVVLLTSLFATQLVNAQSVTITPNVSNICFGSGSSVTLTATPVGPMVTNYQWLNNSSVVIFNGLSYAAISVSPTIVGTYTYTVIVSFFGGGSATTTATITVHAQPTTPTITPGVTTTICQGDVLALSSSAATTYQWQQNGSLILGSNVQVYNAATSGAYKVRITDSNGCNSSWSLATTVNVIPLPVANITPMGPVEACYGQTITLTADPVIGATYQWKQSDTGLSGGWYDADGINDQQTYEATMSGYYGVRVIIGECDNESFIP